MESTFFVVCNVLVIGTTLTQACIQPSTASGLIFSKLVIIFILNGDDNRVRMREKRKVEKKKSKKFKNVYRNLEGYVIEIQIYNKVEIQSSHYEVRDS